MIIQITKFQSYEEVPSDRITFSATIKPSHPTASGSETQSPVDLQKASAYRIFADYQTSFVWAVSSDGLQEEVLDTEFPLLFNPRLANSLIAWSQTYDASFHQQDCDQGSGREVFSTVGETMKWAIEGAVLAAHVAAVRGVPVDYSAYLRRGSECVFIGDAAKDAVGKNIIQVECGRQ